MSSPLGPQINLYTLATRCGFSLLTCDKHSIEHETTLSRDWQPTTAGTCLLLPGDGVVRFGLPTYDKMKLSQEHHE